ncbi:MAG: restriction endonuclease subunit S [Gemmatimonadetes bacterium]|nr:restriction endonuclease subunit S [Gemmatimonadota bacterium]
MKLPSTGELKPYPEMKDSGVEWLGKVPAHWDIRRAKYLLEECDTRSVDGSEELLRVSQYTGVTLRSPTDDGDEPDTRAASLVGYKRVEPDDLVVNIMLAWNGSMGVSQFRGITSPAYCVYRFRANSHPWYFHHLLRSPVYKARIKAVSTGVVESRLRLYTDDLYRLEALVPPLLEQTAIVRFLDHADRRIRRYIRAKQKLIALLEEQKQAIIHQAVTRGIDAAISLKPTGNSWFPEVPDAWDVIPMGRVILRAVDGPHLSPDYLDKGIPFLSARNIKVDRWSLEDVKFISQTDYDTFCQRVKPEMGDVLYTKGGTTGVARAVDLDFPFQVWVHVAVLKLRKDRVLPHYLATVLNTPRCYEQSQLFTRGATNQDLGLGRMKGIVLPLPSLAEQSKIIERVMTVQAQISRGTHAAFRQIELLQEYRTRLIADVVTGKLDVREAAAELPEGDVPGDAEESAEERIIEEEVTV